ncbi:MAG: NUDIX domain-containing protein [Candidatus Saccharimonadaceae bacterium]|nr:NUDIX domain-containing protein [Candidatus Saccharimonadaceae bacterium]
MTNRRINVRGIIFKDGKLFCQKLKPDLRGVERDFWCTPGGGLDENEPLEQGLTREIVEETGIIPHIGRLLFIQQFYDGRVENIEFFFHIENASDFEKIDLNKTSHGTLEIKECKFVDPKTADILPKFLKVIDIESYIEYTRPVYFHTELK